MIYYLVILCSIQKENIINETMLYLSDWFPCKYCGKHLRYLQPQRDCQWVLPVTCWSSINQQFLFLETPSQRSYYTGTRDLTTACFTHRHLALSSSTDLHRLNIAFAQKDVLLKGEFRMTFLSLWLSLSL